MAANGCPAKDGHGSMGTCRVDVVHVYYIYIVKKIIANAMAMFTNFWGGVCSN